MIKLLQKVSMWVRNIKHILIFSASSSNFTGKYRTLAFCRNTDWQGILKSFHLQFQAYMSFQQEKYWSCILLNQPKLMSHEDQRALNIKSGDTTPSKPVNHVQIVGVRKENDQRKQRQGSNIKYIYGDVK